MTKYFVCEADHENCYVFIRSVRDTKEEARKDLKTWLDEAIEMCLGNDCDEDELETYLDEDTATMYCDGTFAYACITEKEI